MREINNCSIFNSKTEAILLDNKITNWLWWEGFNIDKLIETILSWLEQLKIWKHNKWHQLYKDIYRLHFIHDLGYSVTSSKLEFFFYNYIFARDVKKLLYWIPFFKRVTIFILIFFTLNKFWKTYSKHYTLK